VEVLVSTATFKSVHSGQVGASFHALHGTLEISEPLVRFRGCVWTTKAWEGPPIWTRPIARARAILCGRDRVAPVDPARPLGRSPDVTARPPESGGQARLGRLTQAKALLGC
jgi:hypothetical protein